MSRCLGNLGNQQDKVMWEEMYPKTVPVENMSPKKDKQEMVFSKF